MTELPNVHVRAEVLAQALPHMQRYDQEIVVIKYGGHAMGDRAAAEDFAEDIVLLEQSGLKPIVVHGGGPQIGKMLDRLGIQSEFRGGLRVTDEATVEVVEMVLAGLINKQIVGWISAEGGRAVGLCGKDGNMVRAKRAMKTVVDPESHVEQTVDLGLVGEPDHDVPNWAWGTKHSVAHRLLGKLGLEHVGAARAEREAREVARSTGVGSAGRGRAHTA